MFRVSGRVQQADRIEEQPEVARVGWVEVAPVRHLIPIVADCGGDGRGADVGKTQPPCGGRALGRRFNEGKARWQAAPDWTQVVGRRLCGRAGRRGHKPARKRYGDVPRLACPIQPHPEGDRIALGDLECLDLAGGTGAAIVVSAGAGAGAGPGPCHPRVHPGVTVREHGDAGGSWGKRPSLEGGADDVNLLGLAARDRGGRWRPGRRMGHRRSRRGRRGPRRLGRGGRLCRCPRAPAAVDVGRPIADPQPRVDDRSAGAMVVCGGQASVPRALAVSGRVARVAVEARTKVARKRARPAKAICGLASLESDRWVGGGWRRRRRPCRWGAGRGRGWGVRGGPAAARAAHSGDREVAVVVSTAAAGASCFVTPVVVLGSVVLAAVVEAVDGTVASVGAADGRGGGRGHAGLRRARPRLANHAPIWVARAWQPPVERDDGIHPTEDEAPAGGVDDGVGTSTQHRPPTGTQPERAGQHGSVFHSDRRKRIGYPINVVLSGA